MKSVHVIAGRWKRRRLEAPPGARPTSGRAREALFSMVGEAIADARVLDLYAGSGAVGLEAASRGAPRVVLVEKRAEPLARTIARFAPERGRVLLLSMDAVPALRSILERGERFDLVFADPPYAARGQAQALRLIPLLLAAEGMLVLQQDAGQEAAAPPGLALVDRRAYGRNVFFFFRRSFDRRGPRC